MTHTHTHERTVIKLEQRLASKKEREDWAKERGKEGVDFGENPHSPLTITWPYETIQGRVVWRVPVRKVGRGERDWRIKTEKEIEEKVRDYE